eukprot:6986254-Pyramimonas_sp.AAC.1
MHRLRFQYQRNGRGPKKRYYRPPTTNWDTAYWLDERSRPALGGGLAAIPIDRESEPAQHRDYTAESVNRRPIDTELQRQVADDKKAMFRYCQCACKRRAWPAWGAPTELV